MDGANRYVNELIRIINGALRLDVDKVRNYSSFLADKIEKDGDLDTSAMIRKALVEGDKALRPADVTFSKTLPVDSESRFPLVERVNIDDPTEKDVVLSQNQWDTVNEFLSVSKSHILTDSSAITLLMYGPPGTGKSRLARYIARDLGLELYLARLDGLISSFLGSTAKNIRALFEFASKTPCILFLDEFDAIAKLRGDNQEMGELKRVVNSFLQNLDSLGPQSIVIAATNHEELLDPAVWRRFNYRLVLDYPTVEERQRMWEIFLPPLQYTNREIEMFVDFSEGYSGSDIREVCVRLQRKSKALGKQPLPREVLQILQNLAIGEGQERRFLTELIGKDEHEISVILRERNAKLYSHSLLAELFGVSKATAHRRAQGVVKNE